MKRLISLFVVISMICLACVAMVSCGTQEQTNSEVPSESENTNESQEPSSEEAGNKSDIKIGVILVGDESEGYTKAHMDGMADAAKELGLTDDNFIYKYKVDESAACLDAATELALQGCKLIISNSYGHQDFMYQAAKDNPDVQFVAMTGDFAAICGLDNLKNAFTEVYQSRYVSGVVAGLKLKEILDNGTVTKELYPNSFDADGNVKIGYVGAFNYAEVVSGYTAFFLGLRSIVENAVMEVQYTSSWFDIEKEGAAAESLMANGCVIIAQHADSTGAPAAVEKALKSGKVVYSVGYNVSMLDVAPTAALTSAGNNWAVYYKYAFETVMNGGKIDTNWARGYKDNAVLITPLGDSCAEGTKEKVEEVEKALADGTLKVFDTSKFTVSEDNIAATLNKSGAQVTVDADGHPTSVIFDTSYLNFAVNPPEVVYAGEQVELVKDGYIAESQIRSAPYFSIRIDGITEDD